MTGPRRHRSSGDGSAGRAPTLARCRRPTSAKSVDLLPRLRAVGFPVGFTRRARAPVGGSRCARVGGLRGRGACAPLPPVRGWARARWLGPECSVLLPGRRDRCGRTCGSGRPFDSRGCPPPHARRRGSRPRCAPATPRPPQRLTLALSRTAGAATCSSPADGSTDSGHPWRARRWREKRPAVQGPAVAWAAGPCSPRADPRRRSGRALTPGGWSAPRSSCVGGPQPSGAAPRSAPWS